MLTTSTFSPLRTLVFLAVALFCAALLIVLPPPLPTLLLVLLSGTALWVAPRQLRLPRLLVLLLALAWALTQIYALAPAFSQTVFTLGLIAGLLLAAWRNLEQLDQWVLNGQKAFRWMLERRASFGRGLLLLALALCGVAAWRFQVAVLVGVRPVDSFLLLLAAVAMAATGHVLWPNAFPRHRVSAVLSGKGQIGGRGSAVALGALLLWICAEISGNVLRLNLFAGTWYTVQAALLLCGMAFVGYGLGGRPRGMVLNRREALLLAGVLLLALMLRLIGLESTIHRFVDEIHSVDAIVRLWGIPDTPILTPFGTITAFPWLYPLAQSAAVSLFSPNLLALRLPSAIFGTLTVLALYALARTLFGWRTGLVAALILATLPAHIHFSRLGINNIADPLFGVLGLAFLARALRDGQRSDWAWGGVCIGLTQYFYEGGRLLYPPLVLGWLGLVALVGLTAGERGAWIGRLLRGGLRAGAAALLVAAPVYYAYAGAGSLLTPRLQSEAQTDPPTSQQSYEHAVYPWLMMLTATDQSWFMNGETPFVLPPLLPVFLLGAALTLACWRQQWALLLLLWLALTAFGNGLLRDVLWSPRYVVVFPALALLLALGLRLGLRVLWPTLRGGRWRQRAGAALLLALVVLQVAAFAQLQTRWYTLFRPIGDWEDALFRSADLPPDTEVYILVPGVIWEYNVNAMRVFFDLPRRIYHLFPEELTDDNLTALAARADKQAYTFFVSPNDTATLARLRRVLPLLPPTFSPYNVPPEAQLGLYRVPRFTRKP
jgi:hypothetical protein